MKEVCVYHPETPNRVDRMTPFPLEPQKKIINLNKLPQIFGRGGGNRNQHGPTFWEQLTHAGENMQQDFQDSAAEYQRAIHLLREAGVDFNEFNLGRMIQHLREAGDSAELAQRILDEGNIFDGDRSIPGRRTGPGRR